MQDISTQSTGVNVINDDDTNNDVNVNNTVQSQQTAASTNSNFINGVKFDDLFNKDIIELMGLTNLTDAEKEKLKMDMLETIQMRVMARIETQITDEDVPTWKAVVESGDQEKINEYLVNKGINIEELMAQEALVYKLEMAKGAKDILSKTNQTQDQNQS